ncbi:hypothetical protein Cni_G12587 [Canna indica]|uniref:Uncharacterized protein n=1 Tax=Canna indica TaxID=4628 RepID=A0AAQ3K8M0_9LILI|nr:hypothetical protein Cni_G12587 [Canna indica]
MEIEVQKTTILTPHHVDPHAEPKEIPLNIFDLFASDNNIAVLFAFAAPTPSNADIIEALSKALLHFPLLTAQLGRTRPHRRPCLILGGGCGGALVVEATVDAALSDHLPLEPSPDFALLHPSTDGTGHLLQVQLNRFKCGGLVVGAMAHHRVADGQSMSKFFVAWGRTVRGVPIDPLPLYDQSWLKPRCPTKCEFQHWDLEFINKKDVFANSYQKNVHPSEITNVLLSYSSEYIAGNLKARMKGKYTTFETLLAHLWRKITVARGLDGWDHTSLRVTVNGRPRMRPPVPSAYFGNLVLNAYPELEVKRLLGEGGLERAAEVIRGAIRKVDERYFQSVIDFGAMHEEEELVPVYDTEGNVLSPVVEVDSWLKFEFEEMDFGGGGKLCAFLPSWVPLEGCVIFVPRVEKDGGINVVVVVLKEEAAKLKQISHSFD